MGVRRISQIAFALVMIGWGVLGLVKGDFAAGWLPVPESMPARQALAYLTALICIACGVGMLFRQTTAMAARGLFFWLVLWLMFLRVPWMFVDFGVGTWWSASSTAVITATSWVLYICVATDRDKQWLGFRVSDTGLRIARALFGAGLIPIGLAHFLYVEATAPLVPAWLQWPLFWAYFTGASFIAAGLALITGVLARLAAALVTLQIALMTVIVWVPLAIADRLTPFQSGELEVSIVLTACAWVVADSYRSNGWFAVRAHRKMA